MKNPLQSEWLARLIDALLPVFATLAALAVGAVMLLFLKVSPVEAYKALWEGAFGSTNSLAETVVKATPLLFVALGICISFRGDVINIGCEGQMIMGAVLASWVGLSLTTWPGWVVITLGMLGGFLGGAIWGGIPGVLKAYFNVNEILSTVMMNGIAVQCMSYLLSGPMIDPVQSKLASQIAFGLSVKASTPPGMLASMFVDTWSWHCSSAGLSLAWRVQRKSTASPIA
jgi:simple sugar transport system permease protein